MPMKNLITFRKGTASEWAGSSQPLASGEPGFDITNNILKIGNGIDTWSNLKNIVSISGDATIAGNLNLDGLKVAATNPNYPINFYDALTIDGEGILNIKLGNKTLFYTVAAESEGVLNNTRIGGLDGCSIDKTIIGENTPSVGIFSNLSATESIGVSGSLVVQNGNLRIYEDGSPYSTTVSSSGLKINYTTSVTNVDLADSTSFPTPTGFLNSFALDGRNTLTFFPRRPVVGEKILFRNFSDPKNNGVYELQQALNNFGNPIESIVNPIRISPYANNSIVANLSRIRNIYDNSVFLLNKASGAGNSTVGTSNLVFTQDSGEQVMTIQSTKDVDFVASISATAKYFRIKHPDPESEYSVLQYGSLESPYNGVRLTGTGQLKKGICKVQLPSYIKYLISEQNMNVQLTNKGHHKILYIDDIDLPNNCFTVKGYRAKTGGPFEFFWTFTGTRKDVDPLIVEH